MADPHPSDAHEAPKSKWLLFLGLFVACAFVVVVLCIIFLPTKNVWTDDAYVHAHNAVIAPRIPGQIETVNVNDNQMVKRGDVLATLDDRDYRTALADAEATLARDHAEVDDAAATVARQPSLIAEAEANVKALEVKLTFSKQDAYRYEHLATTGAGTSQEKQLSATKWRQDEANLMGAQAVLEAAHHQLDILQAKHDAATQAVRADEARVEQARLNLSYTRIRAPVDGMIGAKTVQVGNYVSPGATIMAVVPMNDIYIEANYREVALRHVRPGQKVKIHLDAYNVNLEGIVDSVPPATGAEFAPIAPENATGNFTKIVQRLPVKIFVSPNQPLAHLLRLGYSVETTIYTNFDDVVAKQAGSASSVTLAHE